MRSLCALLTILSKLGQVADTTANSSTLTACRYVAGHLLCVAGHLLCVAGHLLYVTGHCVAGHLLCCKTPTVCCRTPTVCCRTPTVCIDAKKQGCWLATARVSYLETTILHTHFQDYSVSPRRDFLTPVFLYTSSCLSSDLFP